MHDARLNPDAVRTDVRDAPQVTGKVEDQPRPERFAGQPGARAARMDRQLVLRRIAHQATTSAASAAGSRPRG